MNIEHEKYEIISVIDSLKIMSANHYMLMLPEVIYMQSLNISQNK